MLGWITMPHANGLYVLKEISNRSPSSSVISFHAHFVEYVCARPRGASIALFEAVKPCFAISADVRPARAAAPGWNGLLIDPNCSRTPTGCDAVMPRAIAVRSTSSDNSRAHAA